MFPRRLTNGQQVHEKVLNVMDHEGNANHNHSEMSLPSVGMAVIKRAKEKMLVRR